jgi:hypothetical protein
MVSCTTFDMYNIIRCCARSCLGSICLNSNMCMGMRYM